MRQRDRPEAAVRFRVLMVCLLVITILAVGVTVWALLFRDTGVVLSPDYAPQEEEENAEPIPNDDSEKMEQPEDGASVSLSYSKEAEIDLTDGTVSLYFSNPGKSNQDMVLQIVIQDEVIVQSGTLKPGNQVTTLNLLEGAEKKLTEGGYEGEFIVFYYDPDSGEKAIVNTKIQITITVKG